jgi:hypothetical protein
MTKLVGQFYAKADAGESILFVEFVKNLFGRGGRKVSDTKKMSLPPLSLGEERKDRSGVARR